MISVVQQTPSYEPCYSTGCTAWQIHPNVSECT